MKNSIIIISAILIALSSGCGEKTKDASGVPIIKSASIPVVDGKAMTPKQFYDTYCSAPATTLDATCAGVKTVLNIDNLHHPGKQAAF